LSVTNTIGTVAVASLAARAAGGGVGEEHVGVEPDEVGRVHAKPLVVIAAEAIVDREVVAVDPSALAQRRLERVHQPPPPGIELAGRQIAEAGHLRLSLGRQRSGQRPQPETEEETPIDGHDAYRIFGLR
jgi:hypothetical protein